MDTTMGNNMPKYKIETKAKRLFVDQYGNKIYAHTVKELRSKVGMGGSKVSRMFISTIDGKDKHIGYVVGKQWFTMYAPIYQTI